MSEDELLNIYRAAVDSSMDAAHSREGFASNMSRESILAGLRAIERAAAARALDLAADQWRYHWGSNGEETELWLRARAAEIREGK